MMQTPNAFRAIESNLVDLYESEPTKIPNIEGTHFLSLYDDFNNHTYTEDKKYLHFFPSREFTEKYAQGLANALSKESYNIVKVTVVGFYFPPEIMERFMFIGNYEDDLGNQISQQELIIPLELYDSNLHFECKLKEFSGEKSLDPDYYGPMF